LVFSYDTPLIWSNIKKHFLLTRSEVIDNFIPSDESTEFSVSQKSVNRQI